MIRAEKIICSKSLFAGILNVMSTILIQKALVATLSKVNISSSEGEFLGLLIIIKPPGESSRVHSPLYPVYSVDSDGME